MALLLRAIQPCSCVAVMVVGLLSLAESTVFNRFDQAPMAASKATSAIFECSFFATDHGFKPCKKNGCSFHFELDGQTLKPSGNVIVLKNMIANHEHRFRVNITTIDGEKTHHLIHGSLIIASNRTHVDPSLLRNLHPESKYSLDIILSAESIYAALINIKMSNMSCTDMAGNQFTRTNSSKKLLHLDRRPVEADLWTSIPSYELEINGALRTVTATNKMEDLKIFLDFSSPIINSTNEIVNAFHLSSGVIIPVHSSTHGNRKFVFQLKNVLKTEIIKVELQAASVISRMGTHVSPVSPITFLYDCTEPNVWLSTHSPRVTEESYFNVVVEFTKPVLDFEASKVDTVGGSLTRFKKLSRALYSLTIQAESQNVSVIVPAGKVYDISGNLNSASNQLEINHISSPAISVALHSFISMGILATSLAAAVLSLSSANLEAIGPRGSTCVVFSDPSFNLHGVVGHIQVFVLSDWFSDALPVEYTATTKGLRWLLPRAKLPWTRSSSSPKHNSLHAAETGTSMNQDISTKSTPNGLPLDSSEYFTYFLRGEPMSASSTIERLERYTGWKELEMNLFWLGVGGGSLLLIHILTFLFVRWRTKMTFHGILSVPRFELFLLILALPCISQSSVFVIRGGTTKGILTGALLLAIPAALILSVCVLLAIAIFSGSFVQYKEIKHIYINEKWYTKLWFLFIGRPTVGKWSYREGGMPSSFLSRFGILFESWKGPPCYVLIEENGPNNTSKWIESDQNGIGRLRAVSSNEGNELTKAPMSEKVLGCARSSYIILDLIRRVSLGVLAGGIHPSTGRISQSFIALTITLTQLLYLVTLKPYIRRGVHVVESVCLLCEAGIFGLSIGIDGMNPIKARYSGYLMLGLLFLAFASQITNEWYNMIEFLLRFSHPHKNSFKFGLKCAMEGFFLPLLPRKHWSGFVLGSSDPKTGRALCPGMESERQDARPWGVDPLIAMSATVVPVLSPGSPGAMKTQQTGPITAETAAHHRQNNAERGKRHKVEPNHEMKRLRELARASFTGASKCEEGSTSYGFRV